MENLIINTIRSLSAEMVLKANSGHQGMAIGSAPMAFTLFNEFMKHSPKNSKWIDRDRFILSAGHASALQYSLLHLFGYDLTMEDIKNFRQLGSKTPGHPEVGMTEGVEVTTGPLGQGIAMAVGMAIAEKQLSAKFNEEDIDIINHYTYCIVGDGCMMEGISNEASSIAGTLGLDKLIVLYDSNKITIDGTTDITFRENVKMRYEALGWQVLEVKDGRNLDEIRNALKLAKAEKEKPSFIEVHTNIGEGTPYQGTPAVHGNPLKSSDILEMKKTLRYKYEEEFFVSDEVKAYMQKRIQELQNYEDEWNKKLEKYKEKYPEKYNAFKLQMENGYDLSFMNDDEFYSFDKDMATRVSSGISLNRIAKYVDNLFGGSADLANSNNTRIKGKEDFAKENPKGTNINFGVREHAMAAIANGIQLHGGFNAYVGTFLSFADYMKPAVRLSALMKQPVKYIFTHDSIGLGEDGPTHQAVDQLPMLRAIPNIINIRPCDARETAAAWAYAMHEKEKAITLILSRQNLPNIEGTSREALKGGYILKDFGKDIQMVFMASGSEVEIAMKTAEKLFEKGISSRVISMPSIEIFESQSEEYKNSVLLKDISKRVSIEASSEKYWYKYIGMNGLLIDMHTFGVSAPSEVTFEYFGFTPEKILNKIEEKYNL